MTTNGRRAALLDVQGIQSEAHGRRGVGRYLGSVASALEKIAPGEVCYLLNRDLPVGNGLEALPPKSETGFVDQERFPAADLYHIGSPFEPHVSIDGIWPRQARAMRLVITLYDLIPLLFPQFHLDDPRTARWYSIRLELLRRAKLVLAISETTARDAVQLLKLPPERVRVVGAGVSDRFRPADNADAAFGAAHQVLPGLRPSFVLYTGGAGPRKNVECLLEGYAKLPEELQRKHQLVVVCELTDDAVRSIRRRSAALGIDRRVYLTGYIPDEILVRLYQSAVLFVFPSLYEGFGLPIAEALACGAPVVVGRTPASTEIVHTEEALFDPLEASDLKDKLERALKEPSFREGLRDPRASQRFNWASVAERTLAAYEELRERPAARRRRMRLAFVTPLPPHSSGIADYSYRLLDVLRLRCAVDVFSDESSIESRAPEGVATHSLRYFDLVDRIRGGFDEIIVSLGNSPHHAGALALLRRRSAIVLAHDIRLTDLYVFAAANRPDVEQSPFAEVLTDMYGDPDLARVGSGSALDLDRLHRRGIYMAREVVGLAKQFLVHSTYAATVARAEAAVGDTQKVRVVPFAYPAAEIESQSQAPQERPLVATFGVVTPAKQVEKVVDAFAHAHRRQTTARLAIVGPGASAESLGRIEKRVARLGIADSVEITGHVDERTLGSFLRQATVAVQLRAISSGETPASVADCLSHGIPTVVSAIGPVRELPDSTVVKVGPDISASDLGDSISALLGDQTRRLQLSKAAVEFARRQSVERAADALYEVAFPGRSGLPGPHAPLASGTSLVS